MTEYYALVVDVIALFFCNETNKLVIKRYENQGRKEINICDCGCKKDTCHPSFHTTIEVEDGLLFSWDWPLEQKWNKEYAMERSDYYYEDY